MEPPKIEGDASRRITVELPPTFEDLEHLCLTSFGMVGPVTIYHNGVASLTSEDYNNIQSGDQFIVVDSRGNALDMKDFFTTTYDRDFAAKPLPPRDAPAPAQPYRKMPDGRDFRTTEDDYQAWPIEARQAPQEAQRPPTLPFRGTTEHRDEYSPQKMPPRGPAPAPQEYRKMPDSRDFASEASGQYRPWELPQRQQPQPAERPQSLPFNARSSHQDDYVPYDVQQRAAPPAQQWKPSGIPFNAQSTAASDYKQWELPPKGAPHQVARPPPSLPFTARSTSQDDFRAHQLPSRGPAPSPQEYRKMPDSRDFASEASGQYRPWELPQRQQPQPAERPQSLPFNARSSHQDDYVPYAVQARQPVPPPARAGPSIPFNARTVSQDDYKAHAIPRKKYVTIMPAKQ